MNTMTMTRDEVFEATKKIMTWDSDGSEEGRRRLEKVVDSLCAGQSVVIDATAYIGNGKYVPKTRKDRYRYKMIVPATDQHGNIYSTDLYSGDMANAVNGDYGIYTYTRQLVLAVVAAIEPDLRKERLMHGERGFFKLRIS